METGVFSGLTLDLGIKLSDIFAGVGVFIAQYWPIVAFAIALPVSFGIGRRLIKLGKHA